MTQMIMTLDWQTAIVLGLVAVAAAYTVRSFLAQFRRADDEVAGCSACPAARATLPQGEGAGPQAPAPEASKSTTAPSSTR